MTPELIFDELMKELELFDNSKEYLATKHKYTEHMKQYAREMCDKQKDVIMEKTEIGLSNMLKIRAAPYPKELQ